MLMPGIFGETLFDNWMDSFENDFWGNRTSGKNVQNLMKTDVRETDSTYELDIDLPGYKKEDIKVQLKDGNLTISAAKAADKDEKDQKGNYIRRERYMGSMSRSFHIGNNVHQNDIHAKFEDGILKLSIPKPNQNVIENKGYIAIEG
ncbi:MAG: Hsp20/alpha crystallin family protein [Blautia sp.]|nr:Hsp20/alpha crystallin family protein [Blautia sp.]MDY4000877.1 Hsp20/alpha crystallin family protein [Blautia sp.]